MVKKKTLLADQEIKRGRGEKNLHYLSRPQDLEDWGNEKQSNQSSNIADGSESGAVRQNFISHKSNQILSIFKDLGIKTVNIWIK